MADETDAATAQEPTADAPTLASVEAQAETLATEVAALEHPADPPTPAPDSAGYKKVRYAAPADAVLPAEYVGRWWHANSEYALSAAEVESVKDIRGFVVLGDAPTPEPEEPHHG